MRKMNIVILALVTLVLANTLAFGEGGKTPAGVKGDAAAYGNSVTKPAPTEQVSHDPSHITYLRLYCTPDGNSHFQRVTGELRKTNFAPPAAPLYIGDNIPASTAFFGGFDAGWGAHDLENRLYHPTPAVQFFIILAGDVSVTASDGEAKRLHPGDAVRLEDTAPCKGHVTVVGDKPAFTIFVR